MAADPYTRTKTAIKMAERMEINKFLQEEVDDTEMKMTSNNTEENQT